MTDLEKECKKPYSKPTVTSEKVDADAMFFDDCKHYTLTIPKEIPKGPVIGCCEVDQIGDYGRRFKRNAQSNGNTNHPYEIPPDIKEELDDPNYIPWDYNIQF